MQTKTARSIMRNTEACLNADMTLDKVSDHLTSHHLPGAPVIDSDNNPLGYVSEYDCLKQLMQATYYCDNTSRAEDVMSTSIISTKPEISLIDLATEINASKVNVLPVLENGKVIGLISRGDVMRALVQDLETCAIPDAS